MILYDNSLKCKYFLFDARVTRIYKIGLAVPPETMNLKASSILISVKMISSLETKMVKPVTGPGELGDKDIA